ncbi:homocysteine S-methyltransferase [Lentilactobacillus kosonis]|uniref:S-methylmethionine:homocysteine methyltransferase n=1 Tax=Lentilactobacillus kosonis TaxID=2810561 RepID=A0A401FLT3_9LACO|nr:homocysteine S-methyltransferase [Lentilactobacillus kosonis]GAY73344.1 homocysteine S-methyltransferase [Lentilactobacillus kosonis]
MDNPIRTRLKNRQAIVVDGAMATELEKHGVDTSNKLWSATALINNSEAVISVHTSYFNVGADIAITDTYQANVEGFMDAGFTEQQSEKLITDAVRLAVESRDKFYANLDSRIKQRRNFSPIVAGSIGPYGAFLADGSEYTGAYKLSEKEYRNFHIKRLQLIAQSGVDMFAFETQPNFEETKALAKILKDEFPELTAWITFSIKDTEHLCDGTPLVEAIRYFESNPQISAIGVNCTSMDNIEDTIKVIIPNTSKPVIVYPNNGDIYDPRTKTWISNPNSNSFEDLVPKWLAAGASLIGGCCRTTPSDIREVAKVVNGETRL